jgi:hypothetical protein
LYLKKIGTEGMHGCYVNTLPLTRKNILDRDKGLCAYCGCKLTMSTMTLDHVYPVSKGGLSDWANLRAACSKCNGEKGNKTLSELGWKLRSRVGIPMLTKGAPKNVITKIGGRVGFYSMPFVGDTSSTITIFTHGTRKDVTSSGIGNNSKG